MFKWPSTRKEFWEEKINRTASLDDSNAKQLEDEGWRVLTVWECAIKGKERLPDAELSHKIADWLRSDRGSQSIGGPAYRQADNQGLPNSR